MAVPTRIAFQGGGARLADLLPVVAAIQQAIVAREILVTHVSGTSAGAIAAAMVATRTNARQFVNQVTAERSKLVPRLLGKVRLTQWLTTSKGGILTSLMLGRSISNKTLLRSTIYDLFTRSNPALSNQIRLEELPIDGFSVMVTNITSCQSRRFSKTDNGDALLFDVIADSCAVPFLFKYLGDLKSSPPDYLVDGGVVQNFPIDSLIEDSDQVTDMILGFGFTDDFRGKPVSGVIDYSGRLLSSAMQSSMEYAKRRVGPDRVFEIRSELDTFDFTEALDQILDAEHFEQRFKEAYEWILTKVGTHRTSYERVTLSQVLCRVKEIYQDYVTEEESHNRSDLLRVLKIDSMFPDDGPYHSANDRSYTEYKVAFPDRPMNALRIANPLDHLRYHFNDSLLAVPEPRISLTDQEGPVEFTSIPSRGITRDNSLDHIVFIKGRGLERRTICIGQRAYIYQGLTGLHPDRGATDYLVIRNQGVDPIERVTIVFYIPRRIKVGQKPVTLAPGDVVLRVRSADERLGEVPAGPGEALSVADIGALALPKEDNDELFLKVGWRIAALPPNSVFGLDLVLPKFCAGPQE